MYFKPTSSLAFFSSGCALLNCVLSGADGGGWPLGRVSNVVGDESTGKTDIAVEACANFARKFKAQRGDIEYDEAESALDTPYAETIGFPTKVVKLVRCAGDPVEAVFRRLDTFVHNGVPRRPAPKKGKRPPDERPLRTRPGLFIVDSLDALSDEAELGRDMGGASYGMGKAKALSEMFRRIVGDVERSAVHLMVISQTRSKIGVSFGETKTRAGGKALDFYASQIIWLAHLGKEYKTVEKVKRPILDYIRVRCKKNKVSLPYRECEIPIRFGYGVDDTLATLDWLKSVGMLDKAPATYEEAFNDRAKRTELNKYLRQCWAEVEARFAPTRRKYD